MSSPRHLSSRSIPGLKPISRRYRWKKGTFHDGCAENGKPRALVRALSLHTSPARAGKTEIRQGNFARPGQGGDDRSVGYTSETETAIRYRIDRMMYARVRTVYARPIKATTKKGERLRIGARKTPGQMSRYACNARIMSAVLIKSGTSARAVARTMRWTKARREGGGGRVAETYVSTGRRGRDDCSREPVRRVFRTLSRARSVIQKLKYRLINGGSSFASFLKTGICGRVALAAEIHRKQDREAVRSRFR